MARILGLDIGERSVCGAVLRTSFRRSEVERYVTVPLAEEALAEGAAPAMRAGARRDAIRAVLGAVGKTPDGVVVALPGEEASLRTLELPAAAAKRVSEVLPFELEALLPFPPEEAVLDHQPIATREGKLHLLAAAAQRAKVAGLLEELRDAGVAPQEIAVGAAALDGIAALVPGLDVGGPHVILDVGHETTDLCILSDGRTELARTLSAGGKLLPDRGDDLVRAVAQTLSGWRAQGGAAPVRVLLGGLGATFEGMNGWLASRLELPVEAIALPAAPGADDVDRPTYARALALAGRTMRRGRRLDLRQGEFARARTMGALRQYTGLISIGTAVVFLAFVFQSWASYHVLSARHDELADLLANETKDMFHEETRDPDHARELLDGQTGVGDPLPKYDAFDAIATISEVVPTAVTHDTRRLEIVIGSDTHEGHFQLQGMVSDIAQRDQLAEALGHAPCFHDLENGRTSPAVGQDRINYQVEGVVRCGARVTKNRNTRRHDDE